MSLIEEKETKEKNIFRNESNSNYVMETSRNTSKTKMRSSDVKFLESENEKSFNINKSKYESSKAGSNVQEKSPLDKAFEKYVPNVNLNVLNMSKIQEESSFFPSNIQSLQQNNFDFKSNLNLPKINKDELIVIADETAEYDYENNFNNFNEENNAENVSNKNQRFNKIVKNYLHEKTNKISSKEKLQEIDVGNLIKNYPIEIEDMSIGYSEKEKMLSLDKKDVIGSLFYQILAEGQENDYDIYQKESFGRIFIKK